MAEDLDPRALCSLDDVKDFAGGFDTVGTIYDDLLTREINAVTEEIHKVANREFVDRGATRDGAGVVQIAASTRVFDVDRDVFEDEETGEPTLVVGDLAAAPTAVVVKDYLGAVAETVDLSTVVAEPRRREPWEPVAELRFLRLRTTSAVYVERRGYTIEVTADRWGFPSIPDTIRKAAYTQAALWYARDVRQYATTFNLETGRFEEKPRTLAPTIREMVLRFWVPRL